MKKREAPPEEGPLRADAARNRERVLVVAREQLANGDSSLQMNLIAREAGVGVGTVYRHFPTRQDLLEALVREHLQALLDTAREAEEADNARQGIQRFLHALLDLMLADVGLAEVLNAPQDASPLTSKLKVELGAATRRLLARAHRSGVVRPEVGPDDVRRLMCGVAHAVSIGADSRGSAERYLTILLDGLRPALK
ncbi:TetR/AcrR family transcriptional regulator [Pyxidicoccus xibeiensis]|uniref:TetR/AcrR family transcriptional regulator n=1 Tax=Pyxidicoccus xibeiensis TaxID=2906759 RepID=UPI0020A6DC52|nr:TetR/AcrR family transcriptional regulator [Pyxidicoccus xibeiensis]MCP3138633.1 TetR/AcrR family transcriptional regulator [Pyxidicoccus xibeiensis]